MRSPRLVIFCREVTDPSLVAVKFNLSIFEIGDRLIVRVEENGGEKVYDNHCLMT